MARGEINKSQMIRDALKAEPRKTPTEIAEMLKAQGLKVSGQYVSTIKSNWKKARRRQRSLTVRGTARRTGGAGDGKSLSGWPPRWSSCVGWRSGKRQGGAGNDRTNWTRRALGEVISERQSPAEKIGWAFFCATCRLMAVGQPERRTRCL